MTDSERQQILKMIADGKISAEEGLTLMRALGEASDEDGNPPALPEPEDFPTFSSASVEAGPDQPHKTDPEFDRKVNRFRSLWVIPL